MVPFRLFDGTVSGAWLLIGPPLRVLRVSLFQTIWGLHMRSVICVHERFDEVWPFTADYWHQRWEDEGGCELYRTDEAEARAPDLVTNPETVQRLVLLGLPAEKSDLDPFTGLAECYLSGTYGGGSDEGIEFVKARGVTVLGPRGDVQW